jgi:hypothetical protein
MGNMSKTKLIIELLETHLPDECDIAGKTNVEDIASSSVRFVRAEHGAYLDLTDVLRTLAEATSFISSAFTIYLGLVTILGGRVPTLEEFKERVRSSVRPADSLNEEKRDKLIEDILRKGESISQELSGEEESNDSSTADRERSEV